MKNFTFTLIGMKLSRSLKNSNSTCLSQWKQNAHGYVAQGISSAFKTLLAPSKKIASVHVKVGSNSATLSLNNCPMYCASFFPHSYMWSLQSKMEITTGGSSPQSASMFKRGMRLIVAPSPNQATPKVLASFISAILLHLYVFSKFD